MPPVNRTFGLEDIIGWALGARRAKTRAGVLVYACVAYDESVRLTRRGFHKLSLALTGYDSVDSFLA